MKKAIILLLLLQTHFSRAQTHEIDSLKQLLQNETRDTSRCILLSDLSFLYAWSRPDTALLLAQQGLQLAKSVGFIKGESLCLTSMAVAFTQTGNYPKALEFYLDALKKFESADEKYLVTSNLINIGNIYSLQDNYRKYLAYTFKALTIAAGLNDGFRSMICHMNLGDGYEKLNILDSARIFTQMAYEEALKLDDDQNIGACLNNLGNIYRKMKQPVLAMEYYRQGLTYSGKIDDYDLFCETYLGMAKLFRNAGQNDSALYYSKRSFEIAQDGGFTLRVLDASNFLADCYKARNTDSAYKYLATTIATKDSLYSQAKMSQIQNLTLEETMRQQEIAVRERMLAEERKTNIQYAILAIALISFVTLFILLSNSIMANEKWISFLGVLGLLLVFEFINLLVHPYVAGITHHSPVLMLVALVLIASLLIPLHNRLEHWIKHKLVEKNKRVRLAAAKRTIRKLEGGA